MNIASTYEIIADVLLNHLLQWISTALIDYESPNYLLIFNNNYGFVNKQFNYKTKLIKHAPLL